LKRFKMLVSDIDGTLLNSENEISPKTKSAIDSLKEKGFLFTLCSGRAFPYVAPLAKFLKIDVPFIYSSGAIYDVGQSKILFSRALDEESIYSIMQIGKDQHVGLIAHTSLDMYCQVNDWDWEKIEAIEWLRGRKDIRAKRIDSIEQCMAEGIIRIDIFAEGKKLMDANHTLFEEHLPIHAVLMTRSVEISQQSIEKGSALEKLACHLDFTLDTIIAVGDSANDAGLLDRAGIGAAMETASRELKNHADVVIPSADKDGLAELIFRYF